MPSEPGEVTMLLQKVRSGDPHAQDRLISLIYGELRRLAGHRMRAERDGHTLTPTALVHEAWLRLCDCRGDFANRSHFFAIAANAMRRILVDHARAKKAIRRGGGQFVPLNDIDIAAPQAEETLVALDEALDKLAEMDARAARVVELRYFSGLKQQEIAEVLQLDRRTIDRDWAMARAWLFGQVTGENQQER